MSAGTPLPNEPTEWSRLASKPAFQELLRTKSRFLVRSCVFFLAYYFALLVLVGYFPEFMKKEIIGGVNLAYLFALSQFIMAWVMAFIYVKTASGWDRVAKAILERK
ncbi:MAG TPA: DUF485 domain-containing protein [Verrucomicrobiaceae bacterium]